MLEVAFACGRLQGEEIKLIWILENLLGKIRGIRRQDTSKVGDGAALTLV